MNTLSDKYGLNSRVKLEKLSENHIGIVKFIKSRIIQKDTLQIIEIADVLRKTDSNIKVSLICNNNICSKSLALCKENNIEVIFKSPG